MAAAKLRSFLFLITLHFMLLLQLQFSCAQNNVRAGYWAAGSEFPVSNINSTLFTHLFCAFADLNSQTYQVTVSSANQAQFSTFTKTVQQKNPCVRTLLSIGGGISDPSAFASMASQASSRKSFIDSSIRIARSYGFHGLDLDWEYPSDPTQMTNLGLLLNEWRAAVINESTAVKNGLDWINVMAYDFYGPGWSNVTGPPAALYNPGTQVSGDYGIATWIQSGIPANKIVLGFPFYGYAWRLVNANNNGFFAPTSGAAITPDGSLGYGQILSFISSNNATKVYNSTVVSNYCYSGTTWIGYDD
ncbi:hypothetical protein CCACVL1_23255, partial [Corchorus capsularis]